MLFKWSLRLNGRDQQKAEDLVHDTFVHFVLSRPDLAAIDNLNAYLYTMLRYTRLSQARRASQRLWLLPIVNWFAINPGLKNRDIFDGFRIGFQRVSAEHDEICQFPERDRPLTSLFKTRIRAAERKCFDGFFDRNALFGTVLLPIRSTPGYEVVQAQHRIRGTDRVIGMSRHTNPHID